MQSQLRRALDVRAGRIWLVRHGRGSAGVMGIDRVVSVNYLPRLILSSLWIEWPSLLATGIRPVPVIAS